MVRLGGTATISHLEVFQGLEVLFQRRGIDLDWVLYSDYDMMADAFVKGDIDIAWNGPLGYVKLKRLLGEPCRVIAMRDVDINFTTHFIARAGSRIETVEDLYGKRFALKQAGLNPQKDLAASSFFEERRSQTRSDERDVIERVSSGEFDAGAVSQGTMETMAEDGTLAVDRIRIFWSSPGYSHCCFTAQRDMGPQLAGEIESAFLSVTGSEEVEQAVLEGEACGGFVPGIDHGWEMIEAAAESEGLV